MPPLQPHPAAVVATGLLQYLLLGKTGGQLTRLLEGVVACTLLHLDAGYAEQ